MHRSKLTAALVDVGADRYDREVTFWSKAMAREPITDPDDPDYADFGQVVPGLLFMVQRVGAPPRIHLDIETDEVDAEVSRLGLLGAERFGQIESWWVMRDPAGLLFCVVAYRRGRPSRPSPTTGHDRRTVDSAPGPASVWRDGRPVAIMDAMKTAVTEMLGIEFPILAFSHCRDVVAAVTNAGGFGVLGAVAHSPEQLDVDLVWIEEQTKGRPYGVDLLVPTQFVGKDEGGLAPDQLRTLIPEAHRQWLDDMLDRYGVPPLPEDETQRTAAVGGMRIEAERMAPLLDVAFAHRIGLIASALGPPPPDFIERAHTAGIPVAALAGAVEHATRHQAAGADLIVAQGTEAGGHTGLIATMVLVPEVVDAVAPVPVLAAGGIARGRQLAAGLALGAEGVWCGSVWLTTEEAETTPVVKQKYLEAGLGDTVRSKSITGKPARMLRSAWTDEWDREDGPRPLPMPLQPALVGEAMRRIERVAAKEGSGGRQLATYFVGQVVGSLRTVQPARRVVLEMVEEFIDTMERLDTLVRE